MKGSRGEKTVSRIGLASGLLVQRERAGLRLMLDVLSARHARYLPEIPDATRLSIVV